MRDIAQFLKVLADEARLQILWLLFNHRELCVCDIMEALGITQSKASRHLATLRHAGLVVDRKDATWSYYSLCMAEAKIERVLLESLRAELTRHPGATRVLQHFHARGDCKDRKAVCATGGARESTASAEPKARTRTRGRAPGRGASR